MRIEVTRIDDTERLRRRRWSFYFNCEFLGPKLILRCYAQESRQTRRHGWVTDGDWWASSSTDLPQGIGRWDESPMDDDPELPDFVVKEALRQITNRLEVVIKRPGRQVGRH